MPSIAGCRDTLFVVFGWERVQEQGWSAFLELNVHVSFLFSVVLFSLAEKCSVKWVDGGYLALRFRMCPSLFKAECQKQR